MIKINLLGQPRPKARRRAVPLESTVSLLMLFAAVGLAVVFLSINYFQMGRELDQTNQKIRFLETEKTRLESVRAQVEQFRKDKAALQQRIDVIETLQRNRTGDQELLEMIADSVVRTDALWLTKLGRKGNALEIEGTAGSITAVANFITELKRSGYFAKVEIQEARENDVNPAVETFSFSVTAEFNLPTALAAPPAPKKG